LKRMLMMVNYFPPVGGGGVFRPLAFVKYLHRHSWNITVVTPMPGEFWISDSSLESEIPSGVNIVRTGSLSGIRVLSLLKRRSPDDTSKRSSSVTECLRRIGELFLIPDTYVGWVPFAVKAAAGLCRSKGFDLVYSTSPPDSTHVAAGRIARRFRLPWVADFRDPWISLYLRKTPTCVHRYLHRSLERRVMGADRILVTTKWHERMLLEKYPMCRVDRIPNGYDAEDFAEIGDCVPPRTPFTVMHSGMLTLNRSSKSFLEGFSIVMKEHPEAAGRMKIRFLGSRESSNEEWAARLGLEDNVSFLDNLPHHECVKLQKQSHVLLLIKHDDERYRGLVPGKLFEYIGARRPILAVAPDSEAAGIVRDRRRGEVADIRDPAQIAEKIWKMYRLYENGELEKAYSLEELPVYSREAETSRLMEILDEITEKR